MLTEPSTRYYNMDQRVCVTKEELNTYAEKYPYGIWTTKANENTYSIVAYGIKKYNFENVVAVATFFGMYIST